MTLIGWVQFVLTLSLIFLAAVPLGGYVAAAMQGSRNILSPILGPVERGLYALCGVDPARGMGWRGYAVALLMRAALPAAVCDPAPAILPAVQPAGLQRHVAAPGVQYRHELRHQHQLAGLCRRNGVESRRPDVRPDGPQLLVRRHRHRRRLRRIARLCRWWCADAWQLVGRRDPGDAVYPAAAGPGRRGAPARDGRAANTGRVCGRDDAGGCEADHLPRSRRLPGGDQAAGHQWRRLLQRQLRASVRESDGAEQHAGELVLLAAALLARRRLRPYRRRQAALRSCG